MRSEHGWEVVCLDIDETSDYEDCRAIKRIGFHVANSVKKEPVDTTAGKIRSDLSGYYVTSGGEPVPLQPAKADGASYVRSLDSDSDNDPLLSLPSCTEYESRW